MGAAPAPIVQRLPTCVRLGPTTPPAVVPWMAWQLTQVFGRKTFSALRAALLAGRGAPGLMLFDPGIELGGLWTTARNFIQACAAPQYS